MEVFREWGRTKSALRQAFRGQGRDDRIESVMGFLPALLERCGEASQGRIAALRLARAWVSEEGRPRVYAPSCPDYGHDGTNYTFRGLGRGVSLLAERHLEFLGSLQECVPGGLEVSILVADQEVEDTEIVTSLGVTPSEFSARVADTLHATRTRVQSLGWHAEFMTTVLPGLKAAEESCLRELLGTPTYRARLTVDAIGRRSLYASINPRMRPEDMLRRTARVAAQYLALGRYAAKAKVVVCNHTTLNLSWYKQTEVGLLHNPVCVYGSSK